MSRAEEKNMNRAKKGKKVKKNKIMMVLLLVVIIILGVLFAMKTWGKIDGKDANTNGDSLGIGNERKKEEKQVQIFKGDERPIAVALENSTGNDWPHPGLEDAYLVYEVVVEGGLTKLIAIYKGKDVEEIGYVRSARPYFIDYALENDAVLVHYGHTIMTADDEGKLDIDYIDGIVLSGSDKTFTVIPGYTTGNAKKIIVSIESIKAKMEEKKIRTTSTDKGLNYVAEDYDLEDVADETGNIINNLNSVKINYPSHSVSYTYDKETKVYKRFQRGVPHVTTNDTQLTTKNIIVQFVEDTALGDTREVPDKGYRKLHNIGEGEGYFITNGKYIEITWSKASRSAKTKYMDKEGNEIKINDGNTYIQICPKGAKVTIE